MEEYRIYADARWKDTTRYIGAAAGAVVEGDAIKFAHENGLYVIVQSGEAVEIVPVPEGFKAKEW
jgi:peptidase E